MFTLRPRAIKARFPSFFYCLSWSLFFTDGKYKGIWSSRGSVIFELCKCMLSYIFTVVMLSRSKMESPSRTIKSWLFQSLYVSPKHIYFSMKSSHIFRKRGYLVEIKFWETNASMSNARTVQGSAFQPTQVPTVRLTLFSVTISQYEQELRFWYLKQIWFTCLISWFMYGV